MAKAQLDFSGARNIINPLEELSKTFQQTSTNLGQMISQDEARKQQEIANARQAALDAQNKQLFDLKMGEADRLAKEREANIEFGSKLPEMMDQKTWMAAGDFLNQSDIAKMITDRLGYVEGEAPEVRAAKEAAQLELSKSYDEAGQKQYLSESIGQEISARIAAGLPVTQDMLTQYTGAKKEELTSAQKASEAASKLAGEKRAAADKTLLELEKLREKYASNKTGSGTGAKGFKDKGPIDIKEAEAIKSYISKQISPFGISLGEGDLDKLIAAGVREGYSAQDILKAGQSGVDKGFIDTTFDYEKAIRALPDDPQSARFGGNGSSYGQIMDLNSLSALQTRQLAEATQARQKAAYELLSPEEKRAAKAKESLAGIMAKIEGFNVPGQTVPKAEVDTSPQNESKKEEIKKVVEKIEGGLNKDGTLNADATKAINDSLKQMGIKEKVPKGTTAEKANQLVEKLTEESKVGPYKQVQQQAIEEFKRVNKDMSLSEVEAALAKLRERGKYLGAGFGQLSANALVGLDNLGTSVGNMFRPRNAQVPYMSTEEGYKRFGVVGDQITDYLTGNVPSQIKSRQDVAASAQRPTQSPLTQQAEAGLNNAAIALAKQRGIPYEKALEELKQLQMRTMPTNNRNEILRMPR